MKKIKINYLAINTSSTSNNQIKANGKIDNSLTYNKKKFLILLIIELVQVE